ncbi:VOC family protein [Salegentibacter chungangensis]|uniref:VOC family protein n=1 Tax=Salegentibacter chungangensis TaxID=1335724 RepID=A0ABW3NW07_9FLAO
MKIERLEIYSSKGQEQLRFYRDLLGLEIQNHKEDSFEVKLGYSVLKFKRAEQSTPYHIAIHIPDKQEEEALRWLKERVAILKNNTDEIVDFSNWQAKSMYFYDKEENIMEFISRRNFNKPESAIFSEKSLLGISEIGLATTNIREKFNFLRENCGLEVFDGSFERFCAIGDPEGLIITINKKLKDWFPTGDKASASEFGLQISHNGKTHHLKFEKDELSFVSK